MTRRLLTIDHLRIQARANLPRMVFDFVDGGAGMESALQRNRTAFEGYRLMSRVLNDVRGATTETEIFGKTYSSPFGISPMGLCNIVAPGTDLALARAAAEANVPYCLSSAATTSIEDIAKVTKGNLWLCHRAGR